MAMQRYPARIYYGNEIIHLFHNCCLSYFASSSIFMYFFREHSVLFRCKVINLLPFPLTFFFLGAFQIFTPYILFNPFRVAIKLFDYPMGFTQGYSCLSPLGFNPNCYYGTIYSPVSISLKQIQILIVTRSRKPTSEIDSPFAFSIFTDSIFTRPSPYRWSQEKCFPLRSSA